MKKIVFGKLGRRGVAALAWLLVVLTAVSSAACAKTETPGSAPPEPAQEAEEAANIDFAALADGLSAKYASNENYSYLPAMPPVARDYAFQFHLGFKLADSEYEQFTEMVSVYADPDFSAEVSSKWNFVLEEGEKLAERDGDVDFTVGPGMTEALGIANSYVNVNGKDGNVTDNPRDLTVDDKGEYNDWGNLPRYYMVQWVDLDTGEKLEKPIVQVFEIKTEIKAPQATFFADENGLASFRWEAAEGAEKYLVVQMWGSDDIETSWANEQLSVIGIVEGGETEWHANSNAGFLTAENVNELSIAPEEDIVDGEQTVQIKGSNDRYGVVALGKGGHSSVSKLFKGTDMSPILPWAIAWNAKRGENGGDASSYVSAVGLLPAQLPIVMCDGNIVHKTIAYDFENAEVKEKTFYNYEMDKDGNMTNFEPVNATVLEIYYTMPNTDISGAYNVEDPSENWEEELAKIEQRQKELNRGSGTGGEIVLQDERDAEDGPSTTDGAKAYGGKASGTASVPSSDGVFATNALSEYLAVSMTHGMEAIPIDMFPEASDTEYLLDAFSEAYYQNPMILGIDGLALNGLGELVVLYQDTGKERKAKQKAIRDKVAEITPKIVKDGMSPLEKELAINQYLCDTAEYDYAALENAAENDYMSVDPKFNDSFNAYGILVDGVGVCASYAASFKLLAEAAGLESIIATGYLEGSVAHAWNRVKLDGQWVSVDVTNNDNPDLVNALLNLPDAVAAVALVEDKEFMLDAYLSDYTADSDKDEYYHVEGKYYDTDEIVAELVAGLEADGKATLRTDYFIDDLAFGDIAMEVLDKFGGKDLYGGYWLGVITMAAA